jgi:electron transfer flavoprotein alpha subunit
MAAVVPVREGVVPPGGDEAVAEVGGHAVVVGSGTTAAAGALTTATDVVTAEVGPFAPGAWAQALGPHLAGVDVVVVPASADGRDLAPRIAHVLGRPLLAGAISVTPACAVVSRRGGLVAEEHAVVEPCVATLEPGVRGAVPTAGAPSTRAVALVLPGQPPDAEVLEVLPPDPATVDLAEAPRILAGGAGLGGPEAFELLASVATALGMSCGASRVAADLGWAPAGRFIGTTGVAVQPELYIGLGISGAVQHVSGIGDPAHLVAVNTDASAPLMAMADLAIVTDAVALLWELGARVGVASG